MSHYQPVNCEFHDVIEACVTMRKRVTVVTKNADETHRTIHTIIADVFERDGVEYLKTHCAEFIRIKVVGG